MWLNLALDPSVALPPQNLPKPFAVAINLGLIPFWMHVVQQLMRQHLEPRLFGQPRIKFDQPATYPSKTVGLVSMQFPFGDSDSRCSHSA